MIYFHYETNFQIDSEVEISNWILKVAETHQKEISDLNFIFVDDAYLLQLNQQFLSHDTLTDIITFDNAIDDTLAGDIFISIETVNENSVFFNTTFTNELYRVIVHGVLHLIGFKDKNEHDKLVMRNEEDKALTLLNH